VRRSYVDVARKLGVDEETVRNRLKTMKEMGLLRGWRLILNANLLDMNSSNVLLEFPTADAKEEVISRMRKVPGVVLIQDFYGEALQVAIFTREDEDPGRALTFSQGIDAKVVTSWRVRLPSSEHRPKEIDWRIIGMMLRDADRKLPEIASGVKASTRTVKRRVNMMMASSVFFMQPLLDLKKAMGVTPCHLLIKCAPSEKRRIDDLVASKFERIVFRLTNSDTHSIFVILCMNIGEMKEVLGWARSQKGVELARTDIMEQQEYVHEWLEREVHDRVGERTPTTVPTGGEGPQRRRA
jgi:DNA-binding Lrp family transcriptional regulator